MKNIWDEMYEMKFGERKMSIPDNNSSEYLYRVPGGWIFIYADMQGTTSQFIPFDNEFM